MEIELTSEAVDLVRRKGGTVALDHVRGVGCGKSSEVVAALYLKGKDLSTYSRSEVAGVAVLVSPAMSRAAARVQVGTRGAALWRRLDVRTDSEHEHGPSCGR
ncbi:MAG: hypothetical protein R6U94_07250 [Nitriliruptoraceae bacterium]